jgi:hypothetical protein
MVYPIRRGTGDKEYGTEKHSGFLRENVKEII